MRNISLSLLLLIGISQVTQAMQAPCGSGFSSIGNIIWTLAKAHPYITGSVVVAGVAAAQAVENNIQSKQEAKK